ncbi:mitochondrial 37S ribosomal protein mS41 [Cenococcum geophilum 1.58]|uniref:mitochondrial 37S ribosomal protein mS41 n=1 Tax=Cenococcum geophilum 1.58 TaxID=794803 RepID=UPI00358EF9AB|nr:hypothetical protein K441DRAFT_635024 [Cenococcum geophilum 1.58]
MILRRTLKLTTAPSNPFHQCLRHLHHRIPIRPIPSPTPFVPDPQTFLTVIGRGLAQHAAKIPSWEALFTLSSQQLRELGVEPARSRRYLLQWREKFRNGEYGVGGELQHVNDGVAEMRLVEAPVPARRASRQTMVATATHTPGTRKLVVNVPVGSTTPVEPLDKVKPVAGVKVKGARMIVGPHVEPIKGTQGLGVRLKIKEGLWEVRRGHKVDGGERRRAEVRAKKRAEENKENRR